MATIGYKVTKNSDGSTTVASLGDQVASVAAAQGTDKTTFETALATLVADGASPTQAHVTAVNNAYTTLKADIAAISLPSGVAIIIYDTTAITAFNDYQNVMRAALNAVRGNGTLTGVV